MSPSSPRQKQLTPPRFLHRPVTVGEVMAIFDRQFDAKMALLRSRHRSRAAEVQSNQWLTPRMDLRYAGIPYRAYATVELPGLRKEEISLQVEYGHLLIYGERKPKNPFPVAMSEPRPNEGGNEGGIEIVAGLPTEVKELRYGRFRRSITLPLGTQTSEVSAFLADGMLSVSWPLVPSTGVTDRTTPNTSNPLPLDVMNERGATSDEPATLAKPTESVLLTGTQLRSPHTVIGAEASSMDVDSSGPTEIGLTPSFKRVVRSSPNGASSRGSSSQAE